MLYFWQNKERPDNPPEVKCMQVKEGVVSGVWLLTDDAARMVLDNPNIESLESDGEYEFLRLMEEKDVIADIVASGELSPQTAKRLHSLPQPERTLRAAMGARNVPTRQKKWGDAGYYRYSREGS